MMKPHLWRSLLSVVVLFSTWHSPARAQEATAAVATDGPQSRAVTVTPFVAMDSRGSVPFGAAISFPLGSNCSIETEVGYRRAEGRLNALTSSANLLFDLPRMGRAVPYLATGVGLAQYGAPIVSRQGSVTGVQPRLAFEVNAGGGVRIPVDQTWGMRTDARWFKSFGRNGSEHFRIAHGISFDVAPR